MFFSIEDGCHSTITVIPSLSGDEKLDIVIEWPETNIGLVAVVKCPCEGVDLGTGSLEASRRCGGNFDDGASWEDGYVAPCNFTDIAREICQIAQV